ncbi:MAG: 16S rRNA (guanine(527)-N(7))-methyltransferase RsmG [Proteobacteria bacterium]|nr:16S rRNA (guanine(527)-N(7))-methyltransferase RsmG [Pseudomonadota bacterium]
MADDPRAILLAGLGELGLAADAAQVEQLLALTALVREANETMNLTAIVEPVAMVRKHLLDSLTVQPWLAGPWVIDVGTGAGFPGLPLAILNPGFRFTLIDSTAKKARFVERAAETLGLGHVRVVCERAESYAPASRAQTVVSRALATVSEFVRVAGHLCARDGRLLAMKGRDPAAELAPPPRGWRVAAVERLKVPGLDDARHLVVLTRAEAR